MDMQTKVTFIIETIINDKRVKYNQINIDKSSFKDGYLVEEVSFSECDKVSINFESLELNSLLEIECYDSEEMVIIKPGDYGRLLSPGNCNQDEALVPGYYTLLIRTPNKVYKGMYMIKPSSMEWDSLLNIRTYLENIVEGLSYNLYFKRIGQLGVLKQQDVFLSQVYEYIQNNYYMFINNVNLVIENPLTDIIKVYSERNISRKQDRKSQKWLTKKGTTLNNNPYRPIINFEKHSALSKNIFENKWIKKIIGNIYEILNDIELKYICIIDKLNIRRNDKILELNECKERYKNIVGEGHIANDYKYKNYNRIKYLQREVKELNNNLNILAETLVNLKKMRGTLIHYQHESWLKNIKGYNKLKKTSICLLKDKRYSQIYGFYKNLNCISNKKNKNSISFMHKKTSLLYEYYIFVLIIKILKANGYDWEQGWLADELGLTLKNGELLPETVCKFGKENTYCKLVYDMEVEGDEVIDNDPNTSRFININSKHRRPDIRLALYNDNGEFKRAAIIEVKCRKKRYLVDSRGETEVIEQLKDYYNFGYYEVGKGLITKRVIDKVIVPYPKQNGNRIEYANHVYNFSFIQIETVDKDEIPYGYDELYREISEFLNKD